MIDLYKAAKEKFPLNLLVAFVIGIIIGYFIATYVSGNVGGKAFLPGMPCISSSSKIEAESFTSQSGIQTSSTAQESTASGGTVVGWIEQGDSTTYSCINFGTTGASSISISAGNQIKDRSMEVIIDGVKAATCTIKKSGTYWTWLTNNCPVTVSAGRHKVLLKFIGGTGPYDYLYNFDWFQFSAPVAQPSVSSGQPVVSSTIKEQTKQPTVSPAAGTVSPTQTSSYSTVGTAKVYKKSPSLTPTPEIISLANLDGSGYLSGKYVQVRITPTCLTQNTDGSCATVPPTGPMVYSKDNSFIYEPVPYYQENYFAPNFEGQHFDEVMLYYGYNYASEFFDKLGVHTLKPMLIDAFVSSPPCSPMTERFGATIQFIVHYPSPIICPNETLSYYQIYRSIKNAIHETTHDVFSDTVIDKLTTATFDLTGRTMNEGYAVYFANAVINTTTDRFGSLSIDFNKDTFIYDQTKHGAPDVSTDDLPNPNNIFAFAGSLWNLKNKLGFDKTNKLIVASWALMPVQVGNVDAVIDAMLALLQADQNLYNGVDIKVIRDEFAKHNIICNDFPLCTQ